MNPYIGHPHQLYGVEEVRRIPGVLNVTQLLGPGDVIEKTGSLSQVCMRIHVIGDDRARVNESLDGIYRALDIRDENGNDMILERFRFRI